MQLTSYLCIFTWPCKCGGWNGYSCWSRSESVGDIGPSGQSSDWIDCNGKNGPLQEAPSLSIVKEQACFWLADMVRARFRIGLSDWKNRWIFTTDQIPVSGSQYITYLSQAWILSYSSRILNNWNEIYKFLFESSWINFPQFDLLHYKISGGLVKIEVDTFGNWVKLKKSSRNIPLTGKSQLPGYESKLHHNRNLVLLNMNHLSNRVDGKGYITYHLKLEGRNSFIMMQHFKTLFEIYYRS